MPKLPDINTKVKPFTTVKNSFQKLVIKVKVDVNKYRIEINVPKMEFKFINPVAAICCAWDGFRGLIDPVIERVIKPFINVCEKIFEPIMIKKN